MGLKNDIQALCRNPQGAGGEEGRSTLETSEMMEIQDLKAKVTEIASQPRTEAIETLLQYIDVLEYKEFVAQRTIKELRQYYSSKGKQPQTMTIDLLKSWFASIDVPSVVDVFQTKIPNVFYVTFALALYTEEQSQLEALQFTVSEVRNGPRNRYMLKWNAPSDDED